MPRYVSSDHKDWELYVPVLTFALETAIQDTTTLSPSELVYGRKPNSRMDVGLVFDGFDLSDDVASYPKRPNEWVSEARKIATTSVNVASVRRANHFNVKRLQVDYSPGDHALLCSPLKLRSPMVPANPCKHETFPHLAWIILKYKRNFQGGIIDSISARQEKMPFTVHLKQLKSYYEQITDKEITTPPNEDYDQLEFEKSNEETFEDERLDSTAIHKEKRSTARYV